MIFKAYVSFLAQIIKMSTSDSYHHLLDIDECTTNYHQCDVKATCQNTVGSNICACKPGFSGDGKKCFGKAYQFILYINPQANKVVDPPSAHEVFRQFFERNLLSVASAVFTSCVHTLKTHFGIALVRISCLITRYDVMRSFQASHV